MAATRLLPVLVLALFIGVGAYAASATYEANGQQREITDTFTPSPGAVSELNESHHDHVIYSENVEIVTNISDTGNTGPQFLAAPGKDYTWHPSNGTLRTNTSGVLANANSAQITFSYYAPLPEQRGLATLVAGELEIARLLALVGVVGAVVAAIWRLGQV